MNKSYQLDLLRNAIENATPEELTLMLYDGAIRFANSAVEKIDSGNFETACSDVSRAADIILELQVSLNHQFAIAEPLNDLYKYMYRRLSESTVDQGESREMIVEVRDMLRGFRDTWEKAMHRAVAVV